MPRKLTIQLRKNLRMVRRMPENDQKNTTQSHHNKNNEHITTLENFMMANNAHTNPAIAIQYGSFITPSYL